MNIYLPVIQSELILQLGHQKVEGNPFILSQSPLPYILDARGHPYFGIRTLKDNSSCDQAPPC
jgi:hypothetical protein